MKHLIKLLSLTLFAALSLTLLVSCGAPASDPKDAEAALEANDYEIHNDEEIAGEWARNGIKKISKVVVAAKEGSYITILYFESSTAASEAYDLVKEMVTLDEGQVFEISDAMIYFGDKDAVNSAK